MAGEAAQRNTYVRLDLHRGRHQRLGLLHDAAGEMSDPSLLFSVVRPLNLEGHKENGKLRPLLCCHVNRPDICWDFFPIGLVCKTFQILKTNTEVQVNNYRAN